MLSTEHVDSDGEEFIDPSRRDALLRLMHQIYEMKSAADSYFHQATDASADSHHNASKSHTAYASAIDLYQSMLQRIDEYLLSDDDSALDVTSRESLRREAVSCNMNIACCHLQQQDYSQCLHHCDEALQRIQDAHDLSFTSVIPHAKFFRCTSLMALYTSVTEKDSLYQQLLQEEKDLKELILMMQKDGQVADVKDLQQLVNELNGLLHSPTSTAPNDKSFPTLSVDIPLPSLSMTSSPTSFAKEQESQFREKDRNVHAVVKDIAQLDRHRDVDKILRLLTELKWIAQSDDYLLGKCHFHCADLLFRSQRLIEARTEYEQSVRRFRVALQRTAKDERLQPLLVMVEVSLATALRDFAQCLACIALNTQHRSHSQRLASSQDVLSSDTDYSAEESSGSTESQQHSQRHQLTQLMTLSRAHLCESIELLEDDLKAFVDLFVDEETGASQRLALLRIPAHSNIAASLSLQQPTLMELSLVLCYCYETLCDLYCKRDQQQHRQHSQQSPSLPEEEDAHQWTYAFYTVCRGLQFYEWMFSIVTGERAARLAAMRIPRSLQQRQRQQQNREKEDSDEDSDEDENENDSEKKTHNQQTPQSEAAMDATIAELQRHQQIAAMLLRRKYAQLLARAASIFLRDDFDQCSLVMLSTSENLEEQSTRSFLGAKKMRQCMAQLANAVPGLTESVLTALPDGNATLAINQAEMFETPVTKVYQSLSRTRAERLPRAISCIELAAKELEEMMDLSMAFQLLRDFGDQLLSTRGIAPFVVVQSALIPGQETTSTDTMTTTTLIDEDYAELCDRIWRKAHQMSLLLCENRTVATRDFLKAHGSIFTPAAPSSSSTLGQRPVIPKDSARYRLERSRESLFLLLKWRVQAMLCLLSASVAHIATRQWELARRALESAESLSNHSYPLVLELRSVLEDCQRPAAAAVAQDQNEDELDATIDTHARDLASCQWIQSLLEEFTFATSDIVYHLSVCYLKTSRPLQSVESAQLSITMMTGLTTRSRLSERQSRQRQSLTLIAMAFVSCEECAQAESMLQQLRALHLDVAPAESWPEINLVDSMIARCRLRVEANNTSAAVVSSPPLAAESTLRQRKTSTSEVSSVPSSSLAGKSDAASTGNPPKPAASVVPTVWRVLKHLLSNEAADPSIDYDLIIAYTVLISIGAIGIAIVVRILF